MPHWVSLQIERKAPSVEKLKCGGCEEHISMGKQPTASDWNLGRMRRKGQETQLRAECWSPRWVRRAPTWGRQVGNIPEKGVRHKKVRKASVWRKQLGGGVLEPKWG